MKLSPLAIFMLGLMVAVIALGYGFFQHYKPNMDDAQAYKAWGEKLDAEGNKMGAAVKRVENAQEQVKEISDKWQQTVAVKTPPASVGAGGINVAVNPYDLTVDARTFRNNVQIAVNRQLRTGGITVVAGPSVPLPPEDPDTLMASYFNYPGSPYPVAIFDLGQVTVRGTWAQISENIRAWSRMPNYLAVADGLVVTGTAPNLTANYNVTVVAFIRGKKIGAPVSAAATQVAANTGAAAAGPVRAAGPAAGGVQPAGAPPQNRPGFPSGTGGK